MDDDAFYPTDATVLVTGGAGQLGSAVCERFDELGNTVVMADIDVEAAEECIDDRGLSDTYPLEIDVTDAESIRTAIEGVGEEFGDLDVLVNLAGIAVTTPLEERTPEEFRRVLDVNTFGPFFCTQAALDQLTEGGRIINIASHYGVVSPDPRIYGDSGLNSAEVYGASKAALIHMTKYLAVHLREHNIRVNAVSPGGIYAGQDEYFHQEYVKRTPLDRMGREEDIVDVVAFLSSDSARYITGQNVVVDGGFTIW